MSPTKSGPVIRILLVDDIAEIRGNIRKLLSFESDFEVVGTAGSGQEGLALAKELRPDIVILDINMPDMDGLQVTTQIINLLPETGIIIMSAQDDASYMRLAMTAGAKAFVTKPSSPDELFNTIRAVQQRARAPVMREIPVRSSKTPGDNNPTRAGNIIVVYSPQGGAGCTTIATNLASSLTREDIRVLLVDANLQFGDVGVHLNLEPRSTLVDLVEDIDDLDIDYFENVLTGHSSGLKVLMGPQRPEMAEKVTADPAAIAKILGKIRGNYDFIVVDTSLNLDETLISLMDIASLLLLVSIPTLASVKNIRFVLDLFDQLGYAPDKTMLILNRVSEDQRIKRLAIPTEKLSLFLKRSVTAVVPTDEYMMLDAIRKGIPAVALERDRSKAVIKALLGLSDLIFSRLMPTMEEPSPPPRGQKTVTKLGTGK